jgi:hypothetical protein
MPMLDVTAAEEIADDARARANVLRLAAAQALTGANSAVIFATGSIVGATLAPTISLATVPLSMYVLGLAAGTLPTGAISRAYGRRVAFIIGTGCGVLTGALGACAILMPRSGCSAARPSSADSMVRCRNPIASPPPTAPAPPSVPCSRRCCWASRFCRLRHSPGGGQDCRRSRKSPIPVSNCVFNRWRSDAATKRYFGSDRSFELADLLDV